MTKPTVSRAQVDALEATDRGEVFGLGRGTARLWWRQVRPDDAPHAVTRTVWILIERGFVEVGYPDDDGRFPVTLTSAGRELLDELASREPQPPKEKPW